MYLSLRIKYECLVYADIAYPGTDGKHSSGPLFLEACRQFSNAVHKDKKTMTDKLGAQNADGILRPLYMTEQMVAMAAMRVSRSAVGFAVKRT